MAGVDGRRKRGPKQAKAVIPASKGGHMVELARTGNCWICTRCKSRSTSWAKFSTAKCTITKAKSIAGVDGLSVQGVAGSGRKHRLITAGTVEWCETCGSFSESRTSQRMKDCCPGPPPIAAGNGGMRQQLNSLRTGIHPVTGLRLPDSSGSSALGNGTYSRLRPSVVGDALFSPYVPTKVRPCEPCGNLG